MFLKQFLLIIVQAGFKRKTLLQPPSFRVTDVGAATLGLVPLPSNKEVWGWFTITPGKYVWGGWTQAAESSRCHPEAQNTKSLGLFPNSLLRPTVTINP